MGYVFLTLLEPHQYSRYKSAIGSPNVEIADVCAANCVAVLLSACTTCPDAFVNALLVTFSIATHFTSIKHLYDKYANAATNKPTTTAAIFITFFIAYPAAVTNRNPLPTGKRLLVYSGISISSFLTIKKW